MSNKIAKEELLKQARDILISKGKIRIATIQIKCEIGFIKAKEIFNALAKEGIGTINHEGVLTLN